MAEIKQTPLFDWHVKAKGKMVPFAGFSMPVQYAGIQSEHKAVRTAAGLFDVSHMGNFLVTGKGALEYLQRITVNNISRLLPLDVQYSALCYENGTVVDDILVTYVEPMAYHIVVNAANIQKDWDWMQKHLTGDVELKNQSNELCILALQGPKAKNILQKITEHDLSGLGTYKACSAKVAGVPVVVSRTGYTGEDGFEVFPKNKDAMAIWEAIMQAGEAEGIQPAGLGARDTLRLEAGYSLYGHEIHSETNLVESGLSWIVDWDGVDFIGKKALLEVKKNGSARKLVGLEMQDKAIPREGYKIFSGKEEVGYITSGTLCPTTQNGIALGFVQSNASKMGTSLDVMVRDLPKKALVTSRRFYKRES